MAVYAAHLTRTLQGTPSVFQVAAQEALGATVRPALRKLVEYLGALYPDKLGWSVQWYDELYLLLDLVLQHHYLKHYAASFSESFYGLVRVPLATTSEFSSGHRLPPPLERASLALLVLAPYLTNKLERTVEQWRLDDEDGKLGKTRSAVCRRAAIRVYGAVHTGAECARLVQLARYMCGRTASPSPALAALRLALATAPSPHPHPADTPAWTDLVARTRHMDLWGAVRALGGGAAGGAVLRCVEYGAFLVQFLRWWESRGALQDTLPPPPAPPRDDRSTARCRNKCPLCLQSWKIPTVLPVSGYIFCYVCISRHVRGAGACPVTRWPAAEDSLVRLYIDN